MKLRRLELRCPKCGDLVDEVEPEHLNEGAQWLVVRSIFTGLRVKALFGWHLKPCGHFVSANQYVLYWRLTETERRARFLPVEEDQ